MCLSYRYVCPSCGRLLSEGPDSIDSGEACNLSLVHRVPQVPRQVFLDFHSRLTFCETIPLPREEIARRNYACRTWGCTYHPATMFPDGQRPPDAPIPEQTALRIEAIREFMRTWPDRLDLARATPPEVGPVGHRHFWTMGEVMTLERMKADGCRSREIAAALNKSVVGVRSKWARLKRGQDGQESPDDA